MIINIVCSDTYVDAFSRLDKKTQKKSLETIRLMQRSLRSDSLKVEKLNTKLNFKSIRVSQDFRAIFTQSGNTVLLVYIDHHDDAYRWASRRLQGFDAVSAKPVYEYFEQAKVEDFDTIEEESMDFDNRQNMVAPLEDREDNSKTELPMDASDKPLYNPSDDEMRDKPVPELHGNIVFGVFSRILYFLLGAIVGILITVGYFMW